MNTKEQLKQLRQIKGNNADNWGEWTPKAIKEMILFTRDGVVSFVRESGYGKQFKRIRTTINVGGEINIKFCDLNWDVERFYDFFVNNFKSKNVYISPLNFIELTIN